MLSLTAIGHSWWMLLELVTLACALMSMFSVLATGLREKGLALVTPLVLLLVECSLTLTIAWGHGAVIRGSGDAGAQYMRLLGLSAVIPPPPRSGSCGLDEEAAGAWECRRRRKEGVWQGICAASWARGNRCEKKARQGPWTVGDESAGERKHRRRA